MKITYHFDKRPTIDEIIELYDRAGLRRPTTDKERMELIFGHSNLVVTAWDNNKLAGLARSVTDWGWSCYLADLAVNPEYQKSGIGKKLIELTKEKVGEKSMVLLQSVPTAMEYYPKVGMEKVNNGFIIQRKPLD